MLRKGVFDSALDRYLWLVACLLMALSALVCLVFFSPTMPTAGLDPSWTMGMSRAVDQGLKIGDDLVFTFGPLANLYTGAYSIQYDPQYLIVSLYLAAALFLGVYGVFAGQKRFGPVIIFAVFIVALSSRDYFFMLIPVLASLVLISDLYDSPSISRRSAIIVLLCSPAMGALLLIKLSFSVICMLCIGINVALLIFSRQLLFAAACAVLPLLSFVGLWLVFGQQLASLPAYIFYARPVISGYGEAMAIAGAPWLAVIFVLAGALLSGALILIGSKHKYLSWLTAILIAAYLFIAFKAGYVRDDGHAALSGMGLIFIAVICLRFLRGWRGVSVVAFVVLVGMVVVLKNMHITPLALVDAAYINSSRAYNGLKLRLLYPDHYRLDYNLRLKQIADASDMPALKGTTDIYSYGQAALIASGGNWSPRPVFQSYAAYTPELLSLNADRLKGPRGAENVFFAVQPIDGRMPSTEDGASWPILYSQYQLKGFSGDYALLHRRGEVPEPLTVLDKKTVQMGSDFLVPKFDGQVYISAVIKPTLYGKVRSTLYKPTSIMLKMTLSNGQVRVFRIISGMTQTGFLLSPLVESTADFAFLYGGAGALEEKRVVSAQIYTKKSNDKSWLPSIDITFSGLKPPLDASVAETLSVKPELVSDLSEGVCAGVIDSINGSPPTQATIAAKSFLSVVGWNSTATTGFPLGARNVVVLTAPDKVYVVKTKLVKRPDLVGYFKSSTMGLAGYSSVIDVSGLSGRFQVGLGMELEGKLHRCPGIAFNIDI